MPSAYEVSFQNLQFAGALLVCKGVAKGGAKDHEYLTYM